MAITEKEDIVAITRLKCGVCGKRLYLSQGRYVKKEKNGYVEYVLVHKTCPGASSE